LSLRDANRHDLAAVLSGLKTGHLANQEYKLRELKLTFCCEISLPCWVALAEFAHVTTHWKHLELGDVRFEQSDLVAFLSCLASPSSVSKLSLLQCTMTSDAKHSFMEFMTTRKQPGSAALLREFVFDDGAILDAWSGSSLASMLFRQEDESGGEWYSTVGSALHSLSIGSFHCGCEGFLEAMAENSQILDLKRLRISDLETGDCEGVAAFLCKPSSLEEIELTGVATIGPILSSLRCNGSLLSVSIPGEKESRLANSYCHRNKQIRPLLQSFAVVESSDKEDEQQVCGPEHLYPTLFQVAKQIRVVTLLTTSLSNLRGSIGPIKD
jgi:hypothetical protein